MSVAFGGHITCFNGFNFMGIPRHHLTANRRSQRHTTGRQADGRTDSRAHIMPLPYEGGPNNYHDFPLLSVCADATDGRMQPHVPRSTSSLLKETSIKQT